MKNTLKVLLIGIIAIQASFAQTRTFYFLPPNEKNWIEGIPYTTTVSAAGVSTPMNLDLSKCGWYMAAFTSEPPSDMLIGLGPTLRETIGGGLINLAKKFDSLGSNSIYFTAYNGAWHSADPGIEELNRCSYNMAAIIYDTDPSVHPDFSCGIYSMGTNAGNGLNTLANCDEGPQAYSGIGGNLKPNCLGVQKNVVKKTLNPLTRKIEYSGTDPNECWTSEDWFNRAFTSTPGVNVQHCYDMPFGRDNSGYWKFDSDIMTNAYGLPVGGFFPDVLHYAEDAPDCPSCNTKRTAETFAPLAIPVELFDNYQSQQGDFSNGDFMLPSYSGSIWNWNSSSPWFLHGSVSPPSPSKANLFFCFESHAEFVYDPAQEFYFRGDDDIWVYINNNLVVDLGGNHMSAPGHVKLNTLGLKEGETYPIDIFFCDRRSTQSNIRIRSNIYFGQTAAGGKEPGLFLNDGTICLRKANNSCEALMGMATQDSICGKDLAPELSYKMVVQDFGDIDLYDGLPECDWETATKGKCFGGISIDDGVVKINEDAITDVFLKEIGFKLYASVPDGYSINVSDAEPVTSIAPRFASHNVLKSANNGLSVQASSNVNLEIYNLNGKLQKSINLPAGSHKVSLKDLPKGLYIAKASFGSEKRTLRVVVR